MSSVEIEFSGGAGGRLQAGAQNGSALVDVSDRGTRALGRVRTGIGDSLNAGGRVVAPGAGAAIATTPAGQNNNVYEVYVACSVGAGGLAADCGNMELREGATVLAVLAVGAPGELFFGPIRRTMVGAAVYSVNATGAGTAAVPYAATISADRVE